MRREVLLELARGPCTYETLVARLRAPVERLDAVLKRLRDQRMVVTAPALARVIDGRALLLASPRQHGAAPQNTDIDELTLKTRVLRRLALVTAPDIARVLEAIARDLEGIATDGAAG